MRKFAAIAVLAGALLAGCNRQNPYRDQKSNPQGSPADRTGGSRNVPPFEGQKKK
jgi:hypothetical protein